MKTIALTILLMFVCSLSFGQIKVCNSTCYDSGLIENLVKYTCDKLGIDSLTLFVSPKVFDNNLIMSNNEACLNRQNGLLIMNISDMLSNNTLSLAIMHELVHVKQIVDKRLIIYTPAVIWYENKVYTAKNSVYDERPFEIEAFTLSNRIYKEYKKEIKNR